MFTYPEPFVGRSAERAELHRQWAAAAAGRSRTVLVSGAPGIGKTSLVATLRDKISPLTLWSVDGDENERDLAYTVMHQLLDRTIGIEDFPPAWPTPHAAGMAFLRKIESDRHPILLVVDDVHLVDPESVLAILFALRRLRTEPVLALFTIRPEEMHQVPPGLERLARNHGAVILLEGLSTAEVVALAGAEGLGTLPFHVAKRLREHTAGNPLHLRALLRELSVEQLSSPGGFPAPRSFALLVLGTLSSLSADAQALAAAASVLPEHAEVDQVASVAGVAQPMAGLQELHVTRLVVTRSGDAATTVRFQHPLIRAAIYDDIGPARRTALHHRAAAVLTGDQSLQHLVAAATQPDPEIVGLLRAAAKRHRAAGHWRSAARSLQDAARLSADAGSRDELKLAAADALLIAGDVAGASQLTSQLNLKSPTAHQLVVQARLVSLNGDHDAGKAFAEQAWDRAADLDPATRDSVAAMLTEHYLSMDKAADGLAWADQSLASRWLPRQQAPETVGARATALGMLGRIREGLASLDDMPADPFQLPYAQRDRARHRGTLRLWGDDVAGAITDLRAASGDPEFRPSRHAIISVAVLVDAYFRAGRWDDCTGLIDRATSLIEDTGQIWFASFIHTHAALVPGARGEWDAAERILYRATEAAGRIPTPAQSHFLAEAIGHVAACRGEWPAVITLAEVMRLGHGAATQPGIFTWPVRYAEALVCTGDHVAAEDWLSTLEQQARAQRHRSRLAGIARIRGQLAAARRDHQKARAAFKLAIQLSEGINALEHASALLGYGRYLRRRGERRGAAGQLRNARQCAQALHATPLLDACDAELKAGGMEIHTTLNEPLHTLTPQERVVTGLICAGKTNRQIATELVLSIKTIDYHINNVYHKLNVHSRSELIAKTVKDTAGL